jgi:putative transferase (TIGR04331 family)
MNAPTIVFCDRGLWDFRDEAVPYFDRLRQAGILWDSPESAAAHTAKVYDCSGWWNGHAVKGARAAFVERYALSDPDWTSAWTRALRRLVLDQPADSSLGDERPAAPRGRGQVARP